MGGASLLRDVHSLSSWNTFVSQVNARTTLCSAAARQLPDGSKSLAPFPLCGLAEFLWSIAVGDTVTQLTDAPAISQMVTSRALHVILRGMSAPNLGHGLDIACCAATMEWRASVEAQSSLLSDPDARDVHGQRLTRRLDALDIFGVSTTASCNRCLVFEY